MPGRTMLGLKGRAKFQESLFPQNAQDYRQRSLLEKELLFFAYDIFGIPFVDPVSQNRN